MALVFVCAVNPLKPFNQSNSRKCVSAKSGSESFAKTKTGSKTSICYDSLLHGAEHMSCLSQHLFQCVCSVGTVNRWLPNVWTCFQNIIVFLSPLHACASDCDLGRTCWLVSAGIKSLVMIQLQEMTILWSIRKCVYVCTQVWVSLAESVCSGMIALCVCVCVCVIWIVCTSTCKSSAYEKISLQTKKLAPALM